VRLIDVRHLGRERVICCSQVAGVLIDPGPSSCLPTLLEALGDERPRALLLTHIHLDHAGATGSLVQRWPDVEVYVHERGAPHLIDPTRLLESARRLYGEDMDRLWGEFLPVPEASLRVLRGEETIVEDEFEVAYTPGHASHHVSYLHEGTAFVGDTGGVRITPHTVTVPPTPPPDIDVEAWLGSVQRIRAWSPERLVMTHFGAAEDAQAQLEAVDRRLDEFAARARDNDADTFVADLKRELETTVGPELTPAYIQAAPPDQLYSGLDRYWRKHGDQASREAPSRVS